MLLRALLSSFSCEIPSELSGHAEITGICEDSRLATPGCLFIARCGTKTDGAKFIADAQQRGAIAAVVNQRVPESNLPQIVLPLGNELASRLAQAFYDWPSRSTRVLGVTGTNGKTTTAYLLRHLLREAQIHAGMIGTVETDDGKLCREAEMTTPSAIETARLLSCMRDNGCKACAMEVSSHALDQGRVAGIQFAGAAFTNLTGDHLDYHKTMDAYADAKAKLFAGLEESALAAVNIDDPAWKRMVRDCRAKIVRFGFSSDADYRVSTAVTHAAGTHFELFTPDGRTDVQMNLLGRHNLENALAAASLAAEVFGLSVHQIAAALRNATGAPGRLQPVNCGQPFAVLVDYAHTDDALKNVLRSLRPLCRGKLRVMFGCGGDRDRTKRPRMARVAESLADVVYITSDNPRTEDPQAILSEIAAGLSRPGAAIIESDRHLAIERILMDANENDIVLLAGKGHENYQIIGREKRHFDDTEEARKFLRQQYGSASSSRLNKAS